MEKRLRTQRKKIIDALKEAGSAGCTNMELVNITHRFGGHIHDLVKKGYKIKTTNLDGGLFKYELIAEPADIKYFKSAQEEILNDIKEDYDDAISSKELERLLHQKYFHIGRKGGWYQQFYWKEDFNGKQQF